MYIYTLKLGVNYLGLTATLGQMFTYLHVYGEQVLGEVTR